MTEGTTEPRRKSSRFGFTSLMARRSSGRRPGAAAFLGLAGVVCVSALAVGAVHAPVVLALAVVVLLCAAPSIREGTWVHSLGAAVLGALSLYCLLQSVPMPMGWLGVLAPESARVWEGAFATVQ